MKVKVLNSGLLFWMVCVFLWAGTLNAAAASTVTDGLKSTIEQVISVVTDPQYKDDPEGRRKKLRTIINPKFNFIEMGKRSLATEWVKLTPRQRKQFVKLFEKLLENSYASKIESYQNEQINYNEEIIKGRYAMVKTEVIRKADPVEVVYKMIKTDNEWQVFDFIVGGVSMVGNYRSQFIKIIRKDSFDGLIDRLSRKVKELENGGANEKEL